MSERKRQQARALEYARSLGWTPPGEVTRSEAEANADAFRTADLDRMVREEGQRLHDAEEKLAELQARLDAEVESHAVTRNTVLRQRDRIQALEGEIAARDQAIAGLRKRRARPAGESS